MAQSTNPLTRVRSPSRTVSLIVHILGLASFSGSFWYLANFPTIINDSYGWHFQFLTIIGLSIATLTFIFGLLADLTLSPRLFAVKNTFSLLSAPLEALISILYWGICAIDRELVVPPEIHLDWRADVGFHAMPAILLVTDLLLLSPPWTIRALPATVVSAVLAFSYWGWVEHCFSHNGFYPYPLFEKLTYEQRAALFAGSAVTMTASTLLLKKLYNIFNGNLGARGARATPANIEGKKTR